MFDHAKGAQIVWKEDKDLTKEIEIKKQRNKSVFSSRSTPIHSFDHHLALRLAHLPPSPPPLPHLCNETNNSSSRYKSYSPCAKGRPGRLVLQLLRATSAGIRRRYPASQI